MTEYDINNNNYLDPGEASLKLTETEYSYDNYGNLTYTQTTEHTPVENICTNTPTPTTQKTSAVKYTYDTAYKAYQTGVLGSIPGTTYIDNSDPHSKTS